ncbi:hypothetical protein Vretimale_17894 [Volvox reticuliferus]|uniref:Uncharacterized protein n=1 Tax=Volvox reticuliferus TaxID=1737510 RepID=A0A8J4GTU4_9CHLO|nr:hypothetical protein Vretimale_17894 [Volvox reticuliferus]
MVTGQPVPREGDNMSDATRSSGKGGFRAGRAMCAEVRVVMVYCRSTELPRWSNRHLPREALCMDALFVHDKAAAAAAAVAASGPNCVSPQDVYTWLEDNVDELSGRCGHHAYIFEAGSHLVRKVTNLLISLMAHPAHRPPQRALRATPLDLATMPPQSTSANVNAASATTSSDTSAFPHRPAAATAHPAASPPAPGVAVTAGASGVALTPPPGSYQPPAEINLIDLASPNEHTPTSPAAAAGAATPSPSERMRATVGGSPIPLYWPHATMSPDPASTAAATASQALAGLALAQPPLHPPPIAPSGSGEGSAAEPRAAALPAPVPGQGLLRPL